MEKKVQGELGIGALENAEVQSTEVQTWQGCAHPQRHTYRRIRSLSLYPKFKTEPQLLPEQAEDKCM